MEERLEDLKARSMEVLVKMSPEVREKLIGFARTSRDPKTGKPSPTKAEKRALQSTGDADKALACWRLTVILRDFGEEEFEKHVSDICQKSHQETVSRTETKIKPEEKEMGDIFKLFPLEEISGREFLLPRETETVDGIYGRKVRFNDNREALEFCMDILAELLGVKNPFEPEEGWHERGLYEMLHALRNLMIQILEKYDPDPFIEVLEKRGIKVKICGNCKFSIKESMRLRPGLSCTLKPTPDYCIVDFDHSCDEGHWEPKEKEA